MSRTVEGQQPTQQQGQPEFEDQSPWVLDGGDEDEGVVGQQPPTQPVQQQVDQSQQQQQPPTQQGTGFEIRTKTGHVFRGATPEEAVTAAQDYYDRLAATTLTYQSQGQGQQGTQHQPVQGRQQVPEFNSEAFYKSFATDPNAAMEMWMHHYFGDDPRHMLDTSYSTAVQVSDRIAIADFLASNPDFPASNESGALLVKRLEADGQDLTAFNLEVAYRHLLREGALAAVSQPAGTQPPSQSQQPPQGQPQSAPVQQPIPPSRGAGAPITAPATGSAVDTGSNRLGDRRLSIEEFEALSGQQMREYMDIRRTKYGERFA